VLTYTLFAFLAGFAAFLLGLSVFMYFEGRKFGDNQFTMKLLPPPAKREAGLLVAEALVMVELAAATGPAESLAGKRHKTAEPAFSRAA
jgi:hypothetical protein